MITEVEKNILVSIDRTDGAEIPYADGDDELAALEKQGLIHIGAGRGPDRCWHRVTLTDEGKKAIT